MDPHVDEDDDDCVDDDGDDDDDDDISGKWERLKGTHSPV